MEDSLQHKKDCTYERDEIFNPDCPKCMEIWNKFAETNNLYIATGNPQVKGDTL